MAGKLYYAVHTLRRLDEILSLINDNSTIENLVNNQSFHIYPKQYFYTYFRFILLLIVFIYQKRK
ncbi:MAG: hypothetical protein ACMUIP_16330 [bacterium]